MQNKTELDLKVGDVVLLKRWFGLKPVIINKFFENGTCLVDDYLWTDIVPMIRWCKLVEINKLIK